MTPKRIAMQCTGCGRRVFDIDTMPETVVTLTMKCPHCQRLVEVPLTTSQRMKRAPLRTRARERAEQRIDAEKHPA